MYKYIMIQGLSISLPIVIFIGLYFIGDLIACAILHKSFCESNWLWNWMVKVTNGSPEIIIVPAVLIAVLGPITWPIVLVLGVSTSIMLAIRSIKVKVALGKTHVHESQIDKDFPSDSEVVAFDDQDTS